MDQDAQDFQDDQDLMGLLPEARPMSALDTPQ
jgi:hypothetical protein